MSKKNKADAANPYVTRGLVMVERARLLNIHNSAASLVRDTENAIKALDEIYERLAKQQLENDVDYL